MARSRLSTRPPGTKLNRMAAAFALLAVSGVAGVANAETLRIAIGQAESHAHSFGYAAYAEYLEENSDITPRIFQMSLLSLPEIPNGLRDGVANMGSVVTAYFAAEFAETNLAANLSMLSTSGTQVDVPAAAMSGAMMEYVLLNCENCLAEYDAQNQVFLGSVSTSPYSLLCTTPVTTLADMQGKRMRSGAANFSRWAEHVGAVSVSMPGNEIYDAMSQGVVDCAMLTIGDLIGASLGDVTRAVHLGVPGGVFAGIAINNVNADTWKGLTDEQRGVVLRGTGLLVAETIAKQRELELAGSDRAAELDIAVTSADEETLANYAEFVEADLPVIAQEFKDQYGLEDVDAKIETISGLVEKWKGLTAEIGDQPEALAEVYWTEILAKIDPATYAVE
jgi:TRAP-type transport system periplasmic protein